MNEKVKICSGCSAVNDASAVYCRMCGAVLGEAVDVPPAGAQPAVQPDHQQSQQNTYQQSYQQNTAQQQTYQTDQQTGYQQPYQQFGPQPNQQTYQQPQYQPYPSEIGGVPVNEIALFVGEKADRYLPKFIKKAQTNSRAGFNVVVFLFGFLLGPIVQSFYFFHRRMNKIGAIILAIGVILTAGGFLAALPVFNGMMDLMQTAAQEGNFSSGYDWDDGYYDYDYDYDYEYEYDYDYGYRYDGFSSSGSDSMPPETKAALEEFLQTMLTWLPIMIVLSLAQLAVAIIPAIFADSWYLKHCVQTITNLKRQKPDYTPQDIVQAGGTRSGIWITVLVIYIFACVAATFGIICWLGSEMIDLISLIQ